MMIRACALALVALALTSSGCGGTSSETPWPVEPGERTLGPAQETSRAGAVEQVEIPEQAADAGAKKKRAAEPVEGEGRDEEP